MTARERVQKAIHFNGPDRIPHCLPDEGPNDLRQVWKPGLPPKKDWYNDGDVDYMVDCYGALRYRAAGGTLGFGEAANQRFQVVGLLIVGNKHVVETQYVMRPFIQAGERHHSQAIPGIG